MRGIPRLAIKKPATTIMLIVTMVVMGFLSIGEMPVELLPNFKIPVVTVVTTWKGATPLDVDKLVTKEMEEGIVEVEGVKDYYSYSSEGVSTLVVEFDYGVDIDKKVDLVQTEIDKIRNELPEDIDEPITEKIDVQGEAVVIVDLSGDDLEELRSIGENVIKPAFKTIDGVGKVEVTGGFEKEVMVEIDPRKLSAYGLGSRDVYNIIKLSNINIPIGSIRSGEKKYLAKLEGEVESVEDVKKIVISNNLNKGIVRVEDIANVYLGRKEVTTFYRVNRKPAISILVSKVDDGNSVEISKEIKKKLDFLKTSIPSGSKLSIGYDASKYINQSIGTVRSNAITGLFLASIILFVFLKSLRATIIIALAIPTSIIFTFFFMSVKGININVISLMGLSLGVGMLVDNSVVVLDNIYRHYRELKKSKIEAAEEGAAEIAIPIISSTATTVAVFIPIVLREGLAKEIFSDMSYTITFSLLASLVVALTFVPMISSRSLQENEVKIREGKFYTVAKKRYKKILELALSHRLITILTSIVLFVFSLYLGGSTGGQFMPEQDESQYTIIAELPSGMELSMSKRISDAMEGVIEDEKIVNEEFTRYSINGTEDKVVANIELLEKKDRDRSVFDIVEYMRDKFKGLNDVKLNFITTFRGPDSDERDFQFELYSINYPLLERISKELFDQMKKNKGLVDLKSSIEGGGPQANIIIDRDKVQHYGLRVVDVATALNYQILGDAPIEIKTETNEIDVTVRVAEDMRRSLDGILDSTIKLPNGKNIRVGSIVRIEVVESESTIERKNQIRKITLSSNLSSEYTQKEAQNYMEKSFNSLNPPKVINYGYGGEGERLNDTMSDLKFALIVSIFLVYFILVSQFESFILPFIIVVAIPLSIIGVFVGLFITRMKFNVMVMVGIIMLVGIVVNNAIVLIDYINLLVIRGMERNKAIREAGTTRLRPIAMTTMTTVFGMIPLAISSGEGSEMYKSMAIAVIFGLSLSSLLTLVVIPVLYSIIEDYIRKK